MRSLWKLKSFEQIVLAMGCTKALMPDEKYVISDDDILAGLEKLDDLEAADADGRTLLMNAACYERLSVVNYLLDHGAEVHTQDKAGFTALHFAVQSENESVTRSLILAGADVNCKNKFGNSAIMLCNNNTSNELFELLLENGCDPLQKNHYGISARDIFSGSERIMGLFEAYSK